MRDRCCARSGGTLAIAMVLGCGAREAPTIQNAGPSTVPSTFPCGVETIAELSPFDGARCERNGSCLPGKARRGVGTCTIAASSSFDRYAGRERLTVFEGDRAILSEDGSPFTSTVVFDARLPSPEGIQVGMTGNDLEREVPSITKIECTFDDSAWRGYLLCSLLEEHHPECDDDQANGVLVVFGPGSDRRSLPMPIEGSLARAFVRTARILAIDLGPPCD